MRNRFDIQLQQLNQGLIIMGTLCENSISMSVKAFLEGNAKYASQVTEIKLEIDKKEKEIEQQCLLLLLQQQPVAKDLRVVSSALKMITDIERIGSQASSIATMTSHTTAIDLPNSKHIIKMAEDTVLMVKMAIEAFVRYEVSLAKSVMEYDDVVDSLFNTVKHDIIEAIKVDKYDADTIVDMLMIAKYLERIADHATNIAAWVIFSITGNHVEV